MGLKQIWKWSERRRQLLAYVVLAFVVGVMAAVVAPSLNNTGIQSGWDSAGHLLKAYYFAHHLLPLGHLSGWFPLWHGGFDLFQFYPPLLYYLLGPVTLVLPPELALRLVTAALWLGLVPVTYYFLRSFQLNRLIAATGTALLLALNASFGIGLGALYGVGLLPNGLGAILAVWVLGRMKRDFSDLTRSPRQIVFTGLLLGLLVLAHTFSTYWLLAASLILFASEAIGRQELLPALAKRYGLVLLIGVLVSAYWWVPLALNLHQMGATGVIQPTPRLDILRDLLLATDSGGKIISLLAIGGLAYLAWRRQWRTLGFFGVLGLFSLSLATNAINGILPFASIVASSQYIRFQAFFAWLVMVWAAFGLAGIWELLRRTLRSEVGLPIYVAALAVIFGLVVLPTVRYKAGFVRVIDAETNQDLQEAADYLKGHLQTGDFVLTEFNWNARFYYGSPHVVNQRLPLASNAIWDLDGNFPEGTAGAAQPVLIASVLDQTDYLATQRPYLAARGVRFIVSTHPETRSALIAEPWLQRVWEGKVLSIFAVRDYQTRFGLPPELSDQVKQLAYADPGRYTTTFWQPVIIPPKTTLALSYHPWLRVSADGRPIATEANSNHQLALPSGAENVRELRIVYKPPLGVRLANTVSVVAFFGVILMLARPALVGRAIGAVKRRRRRRLPETGSDRL